MNSSVPPPPCDPLTVTPSLVCKYRDDIIAVGDDDDDGVGGGEMLVPTTGSDRGDRRASSSMIRQSSMTSTLHGEDEYDPLLKADGAVSGSSLLACSLWSDCRGDTLTLRWSHLNGCLSALGAVWV